MYWYAILACELRKHLQSRGIPLPATFTSSLKKLCHGYLKEGVLQLFLAPNTALQYVPAGVEGRQSPNTIYARAIMVQKEFFMKQTAQILDEGNIIYLMHRVTVKLVHLISPITFSCLVWCANVWLYVDCASPKN